MNARLSTLRSKLRSAQLELPALLEAFFARDPLLPGSVYTLRRKCGRPNCHCAEGSPHESEVLSYRGEGRPRNVSLPPRELDLARKMTEEYRAVRKARTQFVRWQRRVLELLDSIEAARVRTGVDAFERTRPE